MFKKIIICFFMTLIMFSGICYAKEDIKTNVDISSLEKYSEKLQQDNNYLPDISFSKMIDTYKKTGSIGLGVKEFSSSIAKYIFREITSNSRLLVELLFISILCALLQNIQNAFADDSASKIAYFACYLIIVLIVIKSFTATIQLGQKTINDMMEFINSMIPALIALLAAGGGFTSAATLDPIIMFIMKITSDVIKDFVLPMTILVVVINIVDNLSDNIKISKLGDLIKQINLWVLGFMMTIFIAVITIRSSTAATMDEVALKTTKFAIDNFIPVVGKCLSDAVSTVAGYSLILKDAVSVGGLIVMIAICIFPLIKIIIIALIYKVVSAVIQPIVNPKVVDCLNTAGNSLGMVFACVVSVAVMFFIMITIIASTGRFILMVR